MAKIHNIYQTFSHLWENLKKMLRLSWQSDSFLTAGYFGSAGINALFPIAISFIYKLLVDSAFENLGEPTIPLVLIAVLGGYYLVTITQSIIRWGLLNTYFDYLLRYRLQNEINFSFFRKLADIDIQHLEDPKTEDLINKARDTMTWRVPDFLRQFSYLFGNLVTYIGAFILLIAYGFWTPIVLTLVTLPRLLFRARFGRIVWSIYGSETPQARKLWYLTWLLSTKASILESRIFQSSKALLKKFKDLQEHLYRENKKPVKDYMKILALPDILEVGFTLIFAVVMLPRVLDGTITVGDYTFFIALLSRLIEGAAGMVVEFGEMYADNLYVDHYLDVLSLPKIVKEIDNPVLLKSYNKPPRIEFRDVSFCYLGSKQFALKNISFCVEPGENVALVGANGAGKTTIVKLLCRFYDVTSGEILINGVNIKDLSLKDWYKHMGSLFQEFIRYDFTVKENIMLGDPDNENREKMIMAAEKSGAAEFIKELPEKYDQLLGRQFEGGIELSIGQWQKLAIARAFYEAAPILILDEPTSAIDAETEYKIFKNINTIYKNKSLIFISHRFSTVRNADKIIVLEKGRIIESGKHDHLVQIGGKYAKMFAKQAIGYK
jgi:ATP-binding cassette, subfamily B, bacterial